MKGEGECWKHNIAPPDFLHAWHVKTLSLPDALYSSYCPSGSHTRCLFAGKGIAILGRALPSSSSEGREEPCLSKEPPTHPPPPQNNHLMVSGRELFWVEVLLFFLCFNTGEGQQESLAQGATHLSMSSMYLSCGINSNNASGYPSSSVTGLLSRSKASSSASAF